MLGGLELNVNIHHLVCEDEVHLFALYPRGLGPVLDLLYFDAGKNKLRVNLWTVVSV